ncbi:tyrosine-type recombinase/integrase [Orenia marismortui]|uniref:tyrosine-type recombinase/integrase n=1 Tax=Orenia marismortui TaxID=46469 RepID=UPI000367ABA1|nr:tyrosine-type recombinase/integrase [Orenia marismortui]
MAKRKIPDILTLEEQNRLLSQFNCRYLCPQRNKVMIRLFLDSGLRLSEMLNLKWKDINLLTGKLKVVEGKGNKDRILWVNDHALNMLKNLKERQVEEIGRVELVFTTRKGTQLNPRDIRQMVSIYSKKAGIEKKISPHSFRHTFASDLLRVNNNIRKVQKALGHTDLSTTMIYTHIVDKELENDLKSFRE